MKRQKGEKSSTKSCSTQTYPIVFPRLLRVYAHLNSSWSCTVFKIRELRDKHTDLITLELRKRRHSISCIKLRHKVLVCEGVTENFLYTLESGEC
jgi:hypothetical protein